MEREQEIQDPHPDFIKGFNEGYALAKYAPEIGGVFGAYAGESERGKGFAKGKGQYAYEQTKEREQKLSRDATDNKSDVSREARFDKRERTHQFNVNRPDLGVEKGESRMPNLLRDVKQNKTDMEIDKQVDKLNEDREPEIN